MESSVIVDCGGREAVRPVFFALPVDVSTAQKDKQINEKFDYFKEHC